MTSPVSPCIKICRMENNYCVGCFRTIEEIEGWIEFSDEQKIEVLNQLKERKNGSQS